MTCLYFTYCSGVSIVDFEQVNADWDIGLLTLNMYLVTGYK